MHRDAEPSKVSLVEHALRESDDFRTVAQLAEVLAGKVNINQLTAALVHLRKHHAVDVLEADGALWFYCTPATDTRSKRVEERVVEAPGNRSRRTSSTSSTSKPRNRTAMQQAAREANEIAAKLRKK